MPAAVDRFHLVAAPLRESSANLIQQIGKIIGLTPYDVRMRVSGALPRSLVRTERRDAILKAAAALGSLGVKTAVFNEAKLPPAKPFDVRKWRWSADGVTVWDRSEGSQILSRADTACLVFGVRVALHVESHIESDVRIGYRGNTSTTYRIAREKRRELPLFAMLIPRDESQRALWFDASSLEFHGMMERLEPTDNGNMRKLHAMMEHAMPGVPIDRTLIEHPIEPDQQFFYNRRTCDEPAVAMGYVLWYLRQAAEAPGGVWDAAAGP